MRSPVPDLCLTCRPLEGTAGGLLARLRWRSVTTLKLRRWRPLALVAAILVLWLGFLELRGLYFPDEGRYAEIPREMLVSGDWVTPRLNGIPYFEKPPLQYWATAAIYAVAGEDEWTTRLWPALAGLFAVAAVLVTARRLFSRRAGWMAAAVMGSCWGYFLAAQFVTLDMSLSSFMTAALCAFLIGQDARTAASQRRTCMLIAWACCALAVLAKGIVGVALPAIAIATYMALTRDASLLRHLNLRAGLAVFAAIAVPWFVLVEMRNPGFADLFFIREHVLRYTQPLHRRAGPWWYFVPIAVAFLMPWLPAIIDAQRHGPRLPTPTVEGVDARRFAWCSAAAIFVFFSLSSSKLPAYILPAISAVALAAAVPLARRFDVSVRMTAWTMIACGSAIPLLIAPAVGLINVPLVRTEMSSNTGWIVLAGVVLLAAGLAAVWLLRVQRRLGALAMLVLASMIACQIGGVLAYRVDSYFSAERLIERISGGEAKRPFRPQTPFYSVDTFDHTVPFYLGRTVTLVREQGELAWGLAAPANYIADLPEFERRWHADAEAYAIMGRVTYDMLLDTGLPMRLVDSDGRRIVVSRR